MHSFQWRANLGQAKWEQFGCASECILESRLWAATATVSRIAARRQIERRVSLPLLTAVKYCSAKPRATRLKRPAHREVPPHITIVSRGQHMLRGVGAENLFQACHAELPCDFALPADESQTLHSADADLPPNLAALVKDADTNSSSESSP
jgi:hypothetical protein